MRSVFRVLAYAAGGALLLSVCLALWAYHAMQQVPLFYQEALETKEQDLVKASDEMVRQTTELISNVLTQGDWETTFTQEQINGWLAVDLKNNHPGTLPLELRNPRVSISPDGVKMACQYETSVMSTVASMLVDVSLREKNVLALSFRNVRAGTFPLPRKDILDQLSQAALSADIGLRWETADGDPVALITIPLVRDGGKVVVSITAIELRDGAIYLRGRTEPAGKQRNGRRVTQLPFQRNRQ